MGPHADPDQDPQPFSQCCVRTFLRGLGPSRGRRVVWERRLRQWGGWWRGTVGVTCTPPPTALMSWMCMGQALTRDLAPRGPLPDTPAPAAPGLEGAPTPGITGVRSSGWDQSCSGPPHRVPLQNRYSPEGLCHSQEEGCKEGREPGLEVSPSFLQELKCVKCFVHVYSGNPKWP